MRAASAGTIALLNSGNEFIMADLYTVSLFNPADSGHSAVVLRWTSYDIPLTLSGHLFDCAPTAPIITRGKTRLVAGLEVDTLDITLGVAGFGTSPLTVSQGYFDNATVQLERVFMPTPGDVSNGSVVLFSGFVAQVEPSSTTIKLTVKSDLAKLLVQMPRNLFQTSCSHVLFDAGCALTKATYTVSGIVGASSSTTLFGSNLTQADDYFRLGTLLFTSGANINLRFSVRAYAHTSGAVETAQVMPNAPANGDTFKITPGCDKSASMCDTRYSNLAHFRGFSFIPNPEATR